MHGTPRNPIVLLEKEGFRFVTIGIIQINGMPDYRLQKRCFRSNRWVDSYLFDNKIQCQIAMEDIEYARLLSGEVAYLKQDS